MGGELLEGERIVEPRADVEQGSAAQQIQPAEPGGDRDGRDEPAGRPARRAVRALLAFACFAWVAAGIFGVTSYVHNYYRYRGFAPPADPIGVQAGHTVTETFWSEALHARRSYLIYLPPGYAHAAAHGARFPVLYMLHGSPGTGQLFIDAGGVGVALDRLVAAGRVRPFLIVLPNGTDGTFMSDTEWANTSHGRYESFVLDTVKAVDATWPTIADRRHRGLAGNSEGAYAAVNVGLRHLDLFSLAEAWSGYFDQSRQGPFAHAPRALVAANSPVRYVSRLAPALVSEPFHALIFSGSREPDGRPNARFARLLGRSGATVSFHILRGGHTWQLWRSQAQNSMLFAGRWFQGAAR